MTSGPTTGAVEGRDGQWAASPATAVAIRAAAALIPFLTAWFVVTALAESFIRPAGRLGIALWLAQALAAGLAVSLTTERFTRRALPLASLFNMTLVFPDQAPSRFSLALRAGTVRKLESNLSIDGPLGSTASEAAAAAIELVSTLNEHDRMTRGHTERVRAYSDLIAEELGLTADERQKLAWGALLHDIGKVTVPPEILNKPDRPDEAEWQILKGHPGASAQMLDPLVDWLGEWLLAAPQHHERWDGAGYPLGLARTDISLAGRIVAVADAYDVLTSRRSYKAPMSPGAARKELTRCAGTQFDPDVVRAFLNVSLRRRWLTGPLASLAELPRVVNLGANLPAASAVVAGTVAAVGSIAAVPPDAGPQELALAEPIPVETTVGPPDELTLADPGTTGLPSVDTPVSPSEPSVDVQAEPTVGTDPGAEAPATSVASTVTTAPTGAADSAPPSQTTIVSGTTTTTASTTSGNPTTTTAPTITTTQQTTTTTQATTTTTVPTTTTTQGSTTSTLPPGSPVPTGDSVTVRDHKDVKVDVLDNDDPGNSPFDEDTLEIIVEPQHAESFRVHNDHIHYKSVKHYEGTDSLVYRICNTNGLCNTATLTITVED